MALSLTNSNLSSKSAFFPLTLPPYFQATTVHLSLIVTVAQSSNPLLVVDIAPSGWHTSYYEINLLLFIVVKKHCRVDMVSYIGCVAIFWAMA